MATKIDKLWATFSTLLVGTGPRWHRIFLLLLCQARKFSNSPEKWSFAQSYTSRSCVSSAFTVKQPRQRQALHLMSLNIPNMFRQVSRLAESLSACFTHVRSLSSVSALMSFQIWRAGKHFVTLLASIFLGIFVINGTTFNHWTAFAPDETKKINK